MSELRLNRDVVYNIRPPFPRNMMIELTNICNHNCIFCGYNKMRRKKGQCDKKFIFEIIEQAYSEGTREVGFYMIGEPLLCKELEEYVLKAKELGYTYIYITTNGAMANIDRMKKLLDAGLNSVKFSINAAKKETYKKVHGKDDYEKVRENIYNLSNYVREQKKDVSIFISFIENELNKNEVEELKREFSSYVDKIYIFPCANQGGGMMELIEKGIVKRNELKKGSEIPCPMLFNRLHITYEGYLDACCVDTNNYMAVLDLHLVTLKEAWYSNEMIELRKQHLEGKIDSIACYNCVYNKDIKIKPINKKFAY